MDTYLVPLTELMPPGHHLLHPDRQDKDVMLAMKIIATATEWGERRNSENPQAPVHIYEVAAYNASRIARIAEDGGPAHRPAELELRNALRTAAMAANLASRMVSGQHIPTVGVALGCAEMMPSVATEGWENWRRNSRGTARHAREYANECCAEARDRMIDAWREQMQTV